MLLTLAELGIVARETIAADDPFATWVIEAASDTVRSAASQPDWTTATAPPRARQIAMHLAARTFKNPDSVQGEGGIGPLGGDRFVEELATALHLTDAERSELEALAPGGVLGTGLWIQPVAAPDVVTGDVYLADSSGSDWMIPYLAEDDFEALG